MLRFDIHSLPRSAAFLAQVAHESGKLRRLTENLNYSASGLMKTWSKRFPTLEKARQITAFIQTELEAHAAQPETD